MLTRLPYSSAVVAEPGRVPPEDRDLYITHKISETWEQDGIICSACAVPSTNNVFVVVVEVRREDQSPCQGTKGGRSLRGEAANRALNFMNY